MTLNASHLRKCSGTKDGHRTRGLRWQNKSWWFEESLRGQIESWKNKLRYNLTYSFFFFKNLLMPVSLFMLCSFHVFFFELTWEALTSLSACWQRNKLICLCHRELSCIYIMAKNIRAHLSNLLLIAELLLKWLYTNKHANIRTPSSNKQSVNPRREPAAKPSK